MHLTCWDVLLWETIGGVRNQQARLANCAISHYNQLL